MELDPTSLAKKVIIPVLALMLFLDLGLIGYAFANKFLRAETPQLVSTPDAASSKTPNFGIAGIKKEIKANCPLNVLFERSVQGNTHVIFNGEDLRQGLVYGLSGDKPLYWDKDENIVYDGKNYGKGGSVAIDGNNIALERYGYDKNGSWQPHIIYNGENIGVGSGPKMDSGHLVFARGGHIIYDGKDLGKGGFYQLKGDDIAYVANESVYDKSRVIYNGKDLGKIWGSGSLHLYNDGVFFSRQGGVSAWYNGEELKEIEGLIRNIEGGSVLWEKEKDGHNHVFLDDKDLGKGGNAQISDGHIAWEDGSDVYFDSTYIGKGQDIEIDGDNLLFEGYVNDHYGLIFNGNDLEGSSPKYLSTVVEDNIVYPKNDNLFCNRVDLGGFTCDNAHTHGDCLFASLTE